MCDKEHSVTEPIDHCHECMVALCPTCNAVDEPDLQFCSLLCHNAWENKVYIFSFFLTYINNSIENLRYCKEATSTTGEKQKEKKKI
jgi:hypothetical protein